MINWEYDYETDTWLAGSEHNGIGIVREKNGYFYLNLVQNGNIDVFHISFTTADNAKRYVENHLEELGFFDTESW